MTGQELLDLILGGAIVACDTPEQRYVVLEFLNSNGVKICSQTIKHLSPEDLSTEFLHPGLDRSRSEITCWKDSSPPGRRTLPFLEIADALFGDPADEPDESEFKSDLMTLLGVTQ